MKIFMGWLLGLIVAVALCTPISFVITALFPSAVAVALSVLVGVLLGLVCSQAGMAVARRIGGTP